MATLADLRARIADELTRPDLGPQIERAISSAVRHYQRRRFSFTDGRALVLTTPEVEFYTLDDIRVVDSIAPQDGRLPLVRRSPQTLEYWQTGTSTGIPTDWSLMGGAVRLYPRPDAIYALVVYGRLYEGPPEDPAYAGVWVNTAEELIRHRAKADLFANVIRENPEELSLARAQEAEAYQALQAERVQEGLGTIRAHYL